MDAAGNEVAVVAEAAGGRIQVELDSDGRLWDLVIDPRAMTLTAEEFRAALISAFTLAQDHLREQVSDAAAAYAAEMPPQDAVEIADRRFAEISLALYDISRRAARR
jgi:DNA-binding protein YbaB